MFKYIKPSQTDINVRLHDAQPGITPYRAHAHKRYSSMNRVPEHDSLTL